METIKFIMIAFELLAIGSLFAFILGLGVVKIFEEFSFGELVACGALILLLGFFLKISFEESPLLGIILAVVWGIAFLMVPLYKMKK